MEITSFVLGMLTIIGMAVAVLVVLGIVKIYKQTKKIEQLENTMYKEFEHIHRTIPENSNEIYQRIGHIEEYFFNSMGNEKREIISYVDSRIDKLQSKKEANK